MITNFRGVSWLRFLRLIELQNLTCSETVESWSYSCSYKLKQNGNVDFKGCNVTTVLTCFAKVYHDSKTSPWHETSLTCRTKTCWGVQNSNTPRTWKHTPTLMSQKNNHLSNVFHKFHGSICWDVIFAKEIEYLTVTNSDSNASESTIPSRAGIFGMVPGHVQKSSPRVVGRGKNNEYSHGEKTYLPHLPNSNQPTAGILKKQSSHHEATVPLTVENPTCANKKPVDSRSC